MIVLDPKHVVKAVEQEDDDPVPMVALSDYNHRAVTTYQKASRNPNGAFEARFAPNIDTNTEITGALFLFFPDTPPANRRFDHGPKILLPGDEVHIVFSA